MDSSTISSLHRFVASRWFVIASGIWVESVGGAPYDFSVYSQTIKTNLGFNQEQLDTVSFCKDIGANVGIIAGLLYDAIPAWMILAAAAAEGFFGYFMMWLAITSRIPTPALWQMCLYMCIAANAQTFLNTAVVVTCVKVFPARRGSVVGLMKGFLGLSGAILVQFYHAIYGTDETSFVLMMFWLIPAVCLLFMFVIRPLPASDANDKHWFDLFLAAALILASYLLSTNIVQSFLDLERPWVILNSLIIFFLLLLPALVVLKAEFQGREEVYIDKGDREPLLSGSSDFKDHLSYHGVVVEDTESENYGELSQQSGHSATQPSLMQKDGQLEEDISILGQEGSSCFSEILDSTNLTEPACQSIASAENEKHVRPDIGEDFTLWQALLSLDFWILFIVTGCGMGSGLTMVNNVSQLGSSLGYAQETVSILVSLWSIWNCLGRIGAGYISESYLHSKAIPRPLFISLTMACMGVGHLFVALSFPGCLYVASLLVGLCYGAQWSLMPATASEIFGLKYFGTLFNALTISSPLATYLLSVKLAGYIYDREAEKSSNVTEIQKTWLGLLIPRATSCTGAHCFRLTFFIMAAICLVGCSLSIVLFFRTKTFYKVQARQRLSH